MSRSQEAQENVLGEFDFAIAFRGKTCILTRLPPPAESSRSIRSRFPPPICSSASATSSSSLSPSLSFGRSIYRSIDRPCGESGTGKGEDDAEQQMPAPGVPGAPSSSSGAGPPFRTAIGAHEVHSRGHPRQCLVRRQVLRHQS